MARRVFFHVGTLKTGTTYIQRVLWHNRAPLLNAGLLVAGRYYLDRVWASQSIREMRQPHHRAATAWARIVGQVRDFDGDVVISHEFFGGASRQQITRALADLAPAEIHIVCTTRDLSRVLPAFWQERVKFRYEIPLGDHEPEPLDSPPNRHWSWRTLDAADILRRWAEGIPPDHVHVITLPPAGAPRDLLWQRFATVCGVDPAVADLDIPPTNESMGLVETELLRRLNPRISDEIRGPAEVPVWVRNYLGEGILASRRGEKLGLDVKSAVDIRTRSLAIVQQLRTAGYHVVGELDDLVGPAEPPRVRSPAQVADDELLDVALDVIAKMLSDYRRVSRQRNKLRREMDLRSNRPLRRKVAKLARRIARPVS